MGRRIPCWFSGATGRRRSAWPSIRALAPILFWRRLPIRRSHRRNCFANFRRGSSKRDTDLVRHPRYNKTRAPSLTWPSAAGSKSPMWWWSMTAAAMQNLCELLKGLDVVVIRHPANLGKGAALLSAFKYAASRAEYLITLDGDGQHFPEDVSEIRCGLSPDVISLGSRDEVVGTDAANPVCLDASFPTSGSALKQGRRLSIHKAGFGRTR